MIEVRTPSRLHFGLLAFDGSWSSRQFGGVGLMIRYPDVKVQIELASDFTGAGRMSDRAVEFAKRFATNAIDGGLIERDDLPGVSVRVVRVPRPHTGLGTGTQLGMAVGRALTRLVTLDDAVSPAQLAMLVGRGQRYRATNQTERIAACQLSQPSGDFVSPCSCRQPSLMSVCH